jgi:hypothetical protein
LSACLFDGALEVYGQGCGCMYAKTHLFEQDHSQLARLYGGRFSPQY